MLLSRIVECGRCGGADDYTMDVLSKITLMAEALKIAHSRKENPGRGANGRVLCGVSLLWDGTVARRPSQLLAHLRKLAEEQPGRGEAWRRLGNAEERFGLLEAAERSWRRALEADPKDLESAFSLAAQLGDSDRWPEALPFLRTALRLLPQSREVDPDHRRALGEGLTGLLKRVLDVTFEPLALLAGWSSDRAGTIAAMNMSSVDVRKIEDWNLLTEFLVGPTVMVVDLIAEMPEDEPTILQRLLAGSRTALQEDSAKIPTRAPVVRRGSRAGPNAPCPCGSGKKHKRCCGR